MINGITIDPGVISEDGSATITIDARSTRGWPLEFDVKASDGWIEPTSQPNVFLWHGPKNPRKRVSFIQRRLRIIRGRH